METLVVEAVSTKYGPSFMVGGVWHSADKKTNPNLTCKVGDTIEVDRNGKWVKSLIIVGSGATPTASPSPARASSAPDKSSPAVQSQICRGNACNAVLGSPVVAGLTKDMDGSEAFQFTMDAITKVAKYIAEGEWK